VLIFFSKSCNQVNVLLFESKQTLSKAANTQAKCFAFPDIQTDRVLGINCNTADEDLRGGLFLVFSKLLLDKLAGLFTPLFLQVSAGFNYYYFYFFRGGGTMTNLFF
jgi:hypothetical protein